MKQQLCAVCPEPGTLRCSRCKAISSCGREHQVLIWSTHKHLCRANEPLVLSQPTLKLAELRQFVRGGDPLPGNALGGSLRRLALLEHATTVKLSGKVPLELGWTTKIHQDEAGGFYIDLPPPEEVEPANEMILASYKRILDATPAAGQTEIIAHVRASNSHSPASEDAFTLVSTLLAASTPSPSSVLATVDLASRAAFELQALVLCTLVESDAAADLIDGALKRLGRLVEGDESLMGVWQRAGEMVGEAVERGRS